MAAVSYATRHIVQHLKVSPDTYSKCVLLAVLSDGSRKDMCPGSFVGYKLQCTVEWPPKHHMLLWNYHCVSP